MATEFKGKRARAEKVFQSLNSRDFAKAEFSLRWLVEGMLVAEQPAVIGGPKKTLKTTIAIDLAISLGSGTPFLMEFAVPKKVRVALISGESGGATIRETALRICREKRVSLEKCGVHWMFELPQLSRAAHRRAIRTFLKENKIEVVIFDPLYLCLLMAGMGASAMNVFEMGQILNTAVRTCLTAGATPIFVHHFVKNPAGKDGHAALEDLAFAGIGEFVRQWLLLAPRTPFVPGKGQHELVMTVGGSAGHSGRWRLDVAEGVTDAKFQGRSWKVSISDCEG